jgi:hypothetical protein
MIDYDYLCQAIHDWREGRRPAAPVAFTPAASHAFAQAGVEEVDSGVVMMDDIEAYEDGGQPALEYQEPVPEFAYGEGAPAPMAAPDRTEAYMPEEHGHAHHAESDAYGGYAGAAESGTGFESGASDEGDDITELDVDAEDDFERDYDLEAQDDFAVFDVANDLSAWFVARMRIEQAWEDVETRRSLFAEYGIRDPQHFHQVQATMDRYVQSEDAAARYGGLDSIMQMQMNAQGDYMQQQMQNRAHTELAGEFEPVEGIGLDEWAQCQAHIAGGGTPDEVLDALGIDQPTWERVSAEWNARMSRDTTATIATAYGRAFAGAGQGQYGAAGADAAQAMTPGGDVSGDPPVPLERFVEIEQAQSAAAEQGLDPSEVLAQFGLTPMDWGNIGGWWGQYIARHGMENDQELFHRYTELQQYYAAQYKTGGADDDIDF